MSGRPRTWLWVAGAPGRFAILLVIRVYRVTLRGMLGGQCRFHPSCSEYAAQAVRELGSLRGSLLAAGRVLRCSPLSRGGVDYPPRRGAVYDSDIHEDDGSAALAVPRGRGVVA